jgi:hypothetical protein
MDRSHPLLFLYISIVFSLAISEIAVATFIPIATQSNPEQTNLPPH